MKAPVRQFEYDDRNHSIAPLNRKHSTSAADLMRRNARGKPCVSNYNNGRRLTWCSQTGEPFSRNQSCKAGGNVRGLCAEAPYWRRGRYHSVQKGRRPRPRVPLIRTMPRSTDWSQIFFKKSLTIAGRSPNSCTSSSYYARLVPPSKEWVNSAKSSLNIKTLLIDG